jgi:PASTA domain
LTGGDWVTDQTESATHGRVFSKVAARPRAAFWTILAVGLVVGFAIGATGASNGSEVDAANARAAKSGGQLESTTRELQNTSAERDDLSARLDDLTERADKAEAKIKRLTAKAPAPDFTGRDADSARAADVVADLDWNLKTREQPTDEASPGTVIAQSVSKGRVLKSGATITLTVAKKPPPKPPTWVTIASFSGNGSQKTDEFKIPQGLKTRLSYNFVGDTNTIIELADPGGDPLSGDLLLNEIGSRSGSTRIYDPGRWYLDVEGGTWNIDVQVWKRPG